MPVSMFCAGSGPAMSKSTFERTIAIVVGAVAVAVLGAVSRDHAALPPEVRTVDPPNPDAAPRMVLPSFEDATRATSAQQPNARKGDK
mgnify:CR=1 FL=1